MTELLLPGAGIPAASEAVRPVRSLSAKSGSTSFSSILHRAARSLRQSGATDTSSHSPSLLSGSLPFGTVASAVSTENVSIPAMPISQAESALFSGDTIRVVSEPTIQAEASSEVALSSVAEQKTDGESVPQPIQDVLHTLAGLVTTLLRQNHEQEQPVHILPATDNVAATDTGISVATPEITGEALATTVPHVKNILPSAIETEENMASAQAVETDKPVFFAIEQEISAPPVAYTAKGEAISATTAMGETVPTESISKTGHLDAVEQEPIDTIQVFVPSIGIVTIQPQPAEDGTLHLNVDIPREIPRTPAVLHNLLHDVVNEVQHLLATNGKTDTNIPASKSAESSHTLGNDSSASTLSVATPNELNNAVAEANENTEVLKGDNGIAPETSTPISGSTPEKVVQEGPQRLDIEASDVSYKNAVAPAPIIAGNNAGSKLAENNTIAGNTADRNTELSGGIVAAVAPQPSTYEGTVGYISNTITKADLSQVISSSATTPVPSSGDNSIATVTEVPQNGVSLQAEFESTSPALPVGAIHFTFTAAPKQKADAPAVPEVRDVHIPITEGAVPTGEEKTDSPATEVQASNFSFIPKEFAKLENSADAYNIRQSYTATAESVSNNTSPESVELAVPIGEPAGVRVATNSTSDIHAVVPERVEDSSKADTPVRTAGKVELAASQPFIDDQQVVSVETNEPVVVPTIHDTTTEPVLPSSVGTLQAEATPMSGADNRHIVSPVAQNDASEPASIKVVSALGNASDLSQPKQTNTSDGIQSFFPYIKPAEEPQKEDGGEQIEEPDLPTTPEPAQVVTSAHSELGDTTVTDTTQVPSVNTVPLYEAASILSTNITEKAALAEEHTVVSGEPAKVDTFVSVAGNNRKSAVSETPMADTVLLHPEEQQESSVVSTAQSESQIGNTATRVAGSYPQVESQTEPDSKGSVRGKNDIAIKNSSTLQRPDIEPDFDKIIPALESEIEPLSVRVQTDGDMVGLDTLLREVHHHGATVTRLSITMPQQVVDLKNHSPKANNNQTVNIVRDTILPANNDFSLPSSAPIVPESTNTLPVDGVEVQSRESAEPLSGDFPVSESIAPSESKIGTSIEGLYRRQRDNGEAPATAPLGVRQPDEQPLALSGQPTVRETATIDTSFQSIQQPVANVVSVPHLYPDNVQVARDSKKAHDAGMTEPVVSTAKVSEYSAPQLQETKPVADQPGSLMTAGRADTQQVFASGNRENSAPRSVSVDRNIAPVVDNTFVPEQNDVTGAIEAISYHVAARSNSPVRTTAGRLSAARNAVESLREHGTSTFSSSAEKGAVDTPVSESLLRSNSDGQENSQTPFRHEAQSQNTDLLFAQNERSVPAGSESYQKVANSPAEPAAKTTEEVHSKNPVWPEAVHSGVPLPVMPKVTPPVVRAYRNVGQQEIPQVVQTAVRTFPAGAGGSIQMMLAPESLGEVLVSISVRDSATEVRIDTETQESRRIVEAQLPALREKLAQAGLQVEHIEVRTKQQDTVQSDASRSGRQGNQTQEEQKSRQDFVRSFRHLAGDEAREQPDADTKRLHLYRMRGGNFERYA